MAWTLRDEELSRMIACPPEERYAYSIKHMADEEAVWGLWLDGWAMMGAEREQAIPIWPHERFAAASAIKEFAGYMPRVISLEAWVERWVPGMSRDNVKVAVFPSPEGRGVVVTPERMRNDLERELLLYGRD